MPITILDQNGNIPAGIAKESFRPQINRLHTEVIDLRFAPNPKRVALLLDRSGSMGSDWNVRYKNQMAFLAAADAIKNLPANFQIALFFFNDRIQQQANFSLTRAQLAARLLEGQQQNPPAKGRTSLWDAIQVALDSIPNPKPGDSIYAITDGEDNSSRLSAKQLEHNLESKGVRLFLLLLKDQLQFSLQFGSEDTAKIAEQSGGWVLRVYPETRHDVSGTTENYELPPEAKEQLARRALFLYRQLSESFLLELRLSSGFTEFTRWKLALAHPDRKHPDILSYPRELPPCISAERSYGH